MDLSKMLNADEAGDRDKGGFERPRLARAHSEQVLPAHSYPEHERPSERFTLHDGPGHPSRPGPPLRLHTEAYSYAHHQYPNAHPQTAIVYDAHHSPRQRVAHPQISHPQTAPLAKPPSPFAERQYPFSRHFDHGHNPGSAQQSSVSGGSPIGHSASPLLLNQSPATPQQYGRATPNKAVALEHRTPSHASSASSHSHALPGHLDSPLSTRSTSQSQLNNTPQQNHHYQNPSQPPHQKFPPTQYAVGDQSQQSPKITAGQQNNSDSPGSSQPGLYNRERSNNSSQDLQRLPDHPQHQFATAFQPLFATPLASTTQPLSQVVQSPISFTQQAAGSSPQITRVTGSLKRERERSISVSPKTILSTLPPKPHSTQNHSPSQVISPSSQMSPPNKMVLTTPSPSQTKKMQQKEETLTPDAGLPGNAHQIVQSTPNLTSEGSQSVKRRLDEDSPFDLMQVQPPAKKIKHKDPPIWARNAKFASPLPMRGFLAISSKKQPTTPLPTANSSGKINSHPNSLEPARNSASVNGHSRPALQPEYAGDGPLGPWEKNILNFEPQEEFTKAIGDFLFQRVVEMDAILAGRVGEDAAFKGQLEIEAKIGTLIDRNTHERLSLPIQTEAVLEESYGNIAFESTMTERQHRAFNEMLNDAVKQSLAPPQWIDRDKPPPKQRIPMHYIHTRETDSFYDLPESEISGIPLTVRRFLRPGQTLRLRVTADQKTGKTLARIVKIRMFDLHVYSPRTSFDWRVSVSFEMEWEGDFAAFTKVASSTQPNRNKDRMSYKHLAYQIDLTQVKQSGVGLNVTHELEIEMAVSTLVAQGKAAQARAPNQYMDLVKTFANNVRTLIRHPGVANA